MKHEPGSLLGNSKSAMNFVAADGILRVDFKPDAYHPLLKTEGRIFENRPDFGTELAARMFRSALPTALIREIGNVATSAMRADDAIRPADRNEKVLRSLRIGEITDRVG